MYVNVYLIHCIQSGKCVIYYSRTATNAPKKRRVVDDSPNRELGDTEKPEVKYTPQHRRKEKLEEKMIEFIDLTSKQTAAEMAPQPPPAPPAPPKDYVATQLEAMGQAMRNSLDPRQQFECLYEMNGVLYRHVRQPQFPLPNQQNYGGPVDGGIGQQGQQGPMMRELNFQTL